MSAKDAKNSFGVLIDTALAEPVTVEKHGRAVVVVLSVEEYGRLRKATQNEGVRVKKDTKEGDESQDDADQPED
jgi:prevent-host-death family protein